MVLQKWTVSNFWYAAFFVFSHRGHRDLLGPKEIRWVFFRWFTHSPKISLDSCSHNSHCVAGREGHRAGRSSRTGRPSRFKGDKQLAIVLEPVSIPRVRICSNYGLISGRYRSSRFTWSSRASGEARWYWASWSEGRNWTAWTSWTTRGKGWCSRRLLMNVCFQFCFLRYEYFVVLFSGSPRFCRPCRKCWRPRSSWASWTGSEFTLWWVAGFI